MKQRKIANVSTGLHLPMMQQSIAQQFLQLVTRSGFPRIGLVLGCPLAKCEIEVLAEIPHVLIQNGLRPPFTALVRHMAIIKRAIQAHAQVGAAFHTDLPTAGLA
jgi:hypothetical protein